MATELLVTDRIREGGDLLEALDRAHFPVAAAFWYLNDGRWRYIIATPVFDMAGPEETYRQMDEIRRSSGVDMALWNITVTGLHDQLAELLRATFRTGPKDINGLRFGGGTIDHVFFEDVYVYRAA